jgi:hypothetical protein
MKIIKSILRIIAVLILIESVLIIMALSLSILQISVNFAAIIGGMYGSLFVTFHWLLNAVVFILTLILLLTVKPKQKKKGYYTVLLSALFVNFYLTYICQFINTPDIFTFNDLGRASQRFFNLTTFGIFKR